jgi:Restriction endonuclease
MLVLIQCKNYSKNISIDKIREFITTLGSHKFDMKLGIFISPKGFSNPCYLLSSKHNNLLLLTDSSKIVMNIKNYYLLKSDKFDNNILESNYFTSSIKISIFYIYIFFLTILLFILIRMVIVNIF